ncbi:ankyrin repeat domain-containing protein [Rubrivivax gelatinosus]|uniref:ankyrin repeat domain-containing protein n=1 Tax=Rubrivivax gelatinosus TaxID=28068 RepID=UPI0005C24F46|nr:ankyrin repeat domain-containing protein [Rubrivivax gelatinosus]
MVYAWPLLAFGAPQNQQIALDVSAVFGAADQRERAQARFADEASRRFLRLAERGDLAAMTAQVREGYAVDTPGEQGVTPLLAYVAYVRPVRADVVAHLLALGADPTRPLANGMSLLNAAARVRDPQLLPVLLKAGVSPDARLPVQGETFLSLAIREGNTDLALALLRAGARADLATGDGSPPLQLATGMGNWIVADALLRAGASIDPPRLAHALNLNPPAPDTPQGRAHAAVSARLQMR